MALRLRRGTDAERLLITPVQGELIYTTDTKKLYIGDGVTAGGRLVEGAGSPDLAGLADVDIAGATDGQVLTYNTATLKWTPVTPAASSGTGDGVVDGSNYRINIVGDDSSVILNTTTYEVTANLIGDSYGTHVGDVIGSVFGDDSVPLIDGVSSKIVGDIDNFETSSVSLIGSSIRVGSVLNPNTILTTTDEDLILTTTNATGTVVSVKPVRIGGVTVTGDASLTLLTEATNSSPVIVYVSADDAFSGAYTIAKSRGTKDSPDAVQSGDILGGFLTTGHNSVGYRPAGGIRVLASDTPTANSIPSSVEVFTFNSSGIPQTKLSVGNNGRTTFTGMAQLAVYADTDARDVADTPVAGMICLVSDGDGAGNPKFQGYTGLGWVDLN